MDLIDLTHRIACIPNAQHAASITDYTLDHRQGDDGISDAPPYQTSQQAFMAV